MTSDAKWVTPASIEFVGKAVDGGSEFVIIPPFRDSVVARIHAWATGFGDPDHPNSTAFLKVSVNGKEIASVQDARFNLYSLQIDRAITIPAKSETKIEMVCGNRLATEAGDPAHGFLVTVESV